MKGGVKHSNVTRDSLCNTAVTMRQALCPSVETQEGGTDGSSYTGGNGLERNTADGQRLRRLSSQDKEDQGLNWRHDRRD